jgi:NAD(P)H-hydrate epimerase
MKLLSASQIKEVDKCSILKQGITSLELMERAASMFVQESLKHIHPNNKIHIYCGKGNNGGDGLVAARKLNQLGFEVIVFIVQHSLNASEDFQKNFDRLKTTNVQLIDVFSENDFIDIDDKSNIICIDAILGSGVNKPSSGIIKQVIDFINQNYSTIISIDVPSGLFLDSLNHPNDSIIKAHYTFTFQLPKLSFFLPENQLFVGN